MVALCWASGMCGTVFAGVCVDLHEVSDQGVVNSTESHWAVVRRVAHCRALPLSFLLGPHPFFT